MLRQRVKNNTTCSFCQFSHKPTEKCRAFDNQQAFDHPKAFFLSKKDNHSFTLDHMNTWQKFLYYSGKALAGIMAIGCGVQTAAAAILLLSFATGALPLLVSFCFFMATAITNWYIFKSAVPDVMLSLFGRKTSEDLFRLKEGCDLIKVSDFQSFNENPHTYLHSKAAYVHDYKEEKIYFYHQDKNTQQWRSECIADKATFEGVQKLSRFESIMRTRQLKNNTAVILSANGIDVIQALTGHQFISTAKTLNMAIGAILALSVGITFGALTYVSAFSITGAFGFLAAISPLFPPLAAILASATLICLTALMFKEFIQLVREDDILTTCKNFLYEMVRTDTRTVVLDMNEVPTLDNLPQVPGQTFNAAYVRVGAQTYFCDKSAKLVVHLSENPDKNINQLEEKESFSPEALGIDSEAHGTLLSYEKVKGIINHTQKLGQRYKPQWQVYVERALTIMATAAFLPIALLGLFMTQNACAPGVKAILLGAIPQASAMVVDIISNIICLGLAFVGQIPFVVSTAFQTITAFFNTSTIINNSNSWIQNNAKALDMKSQVAALSLVEKLQLNTLYLLAFINAVGNGFISMIGMSASVILRGLAGIGGWWNSFTAGSSSIRSGFEGAPEERLISLYKAQQDKQFWATFGMITAAIVLTPLSLLITYPRWKKLQDEPVVIREQFATNDFEQRMATKKAAFELYQQEHPDFKRNKPDNKEKKVVIPSSDGETMTVYFANSKQRERFFQFYKKPANFAFNNTEPLDYNASLANN